MKQRLLTMLMALVAIMMPIGAWALNYTLKMPNTGITTLYVPFTLDLPEGVRAYIVTGVTINDDGTVQLVEKELEGGIPELTPVIIRGDRSVASITFPIATDMELTPIDDNNLLKGTLVQMPLDVSSETGNFMLYYTDASSEYGLELADWQAPVEPNGNYTYKLSSNMAYLQLPPESYSSKFAALKALPHLQHTHGGCKICGQVTGVEAAWGASSDDLTLGGTLAEAVAAAGIEGSNIGYIKLLANVEDDIYVEGGNFTLDLNGHTISSEEHTLDIKGNKSKVTIVDGSETKEGKVITSGNGCITVFVEGGASVTIEEGTYVSTYYNVLQVDSKSSVTINGGSFISADGYASISYLSGSINLSTYPIENITDISITSWIASSFIPSAETILLPEGYCFYNGEDPVSVLKYSCDYCIGKEPETIYTITFAAGDGVEGEMADGISYGDYLLPECTFTAPEGMMFKAWQIGDEEYQPGDDVTIETNTTITALWTDYVPQIIIRMHDSANDGWHGDAIVVKKNGKEMGTATIEEGADGIVSYEYDNTAEYTFYWSCNHEQELEENPDYLCYPNECSFEILIDDEEVFAAVRDEEENTSDCKTYENGELLYSIEGKNVVLENLTIADGELTEYSNAASFTTVGTLTYTRTLPNLMWNALYVPFEIPVSELTENYDVAYVNDVHSFDTDDDGEIDDLQMEIIKITSGTLKANYPYLIRAKNEGAKEMNLELTDATLRATIENKVTCSSVFMQFDVTGTYNTMSQADYPDILAISTDGSWNKLAEDTELKPFRLYLTLTALDGSPVKVEEEALTRMRIVIRGEEGNETGIDQITTSHDKQTTTYFDLSGRRVKTPVKAGLYIVNGKKVVY